MPNDPANQSQVRIIAEQMLDVWAARQANNSSWVAKAAFALSILGVAFSAGILKSDVASATSKTESLELRVADQEKDMKHANDRLARIETKIDLLVKRSE